MTDLRDAFQSLVAHPTSAPRPIAGVVARGERLARRRRLRRVAVTGALAGISLVGTFVAIQHDSDPEIVLATEGPRSAGYIAEAPGGYVATGVWRLTITRGDQIFELSSAVSQSCGGTGTIRPGDHVRGFITGPDSSLRVGDSFACSQ